MFSPRDNYDPKIVKQRPNCLNVKKALREEQKTEISSILNTTSSAVLKALPHHRILAVETCDESMVIDNLKKPATTRNASVDGAFIITGVDQVTDNEQFLKDNLSKIPLRINQQRGFTKLRYSPTIESTSNKISSKNVRTTKALNQNELVLSGSSASQRRSLEMQFQCKKKKMVQLKNEIYDKQKAASEMYENLVLLRKKLKACGKEMYLSTFNLLNCGDGLEKYKSDKNTRETNENFKTNLEMAETINTTIEQICKFLLNKRLELVEVLGKMSKTPTNRKQLQQNIPLLIGENMEKGDARNTKEFDNFSSFVKQIKLLQEKLNNKEQKLAKVTTNLNEAQQKNEENRAAYDKIISELKEQLKQKEDEINQNKITLQNYSEKNDLYDQHIQSLHKRIKETEGKMRKTESKCWQLQKAIRY